jgi:ectoine hydroxylase-related dioxygenase (phytanoyl-CoA dioxygenase family)
MIDDLPPLDAELAQLDRDGFVILESLLSAGERAAIATALAPFEAGRPMGRNDFEGERTQRVYSLAGKGEVFLRLAEHPRIVRILAARLLPGYLLSNLQSIRLHPGETPQGFHTDDAFYPIPRPHASLALSTIWAIEDFTEENGATELVPGSHLWGAEHPDDRPHQVKKAVMPAGSVVIFDGSLWHRGGENTSRGTRLGVSPQYCQPWLRPQESQLLIVPPERARACSPGMRSMLGYNIHPPFVGQVDGMHPLRLVDPDYRQHKTKDHLVADQVLARPVSDMTGSRT